MKEDKALWDIFEELDLRDNRWMPCIGRVSTAIPHDITFHDFLVSVNPLYLHWIPAFLFKQILSWRRCVGWHRMSEGAINLYPGESRPKISVAKGFKLRDDALL